MIYTGQQAIDYLAAKANENDVAESSHWQQYHSAFRFLGDGFEGLKGFGGNRKPLKGAKFYLHRLLQIRFRRI